jgi:hypothetical protein
LSLFFLVFPSILVEGDCACSSGIGTDSCMYGS